VITVGKVAKMFGISRTTLLYYDNIGVFCPSERGENGYRYYCENDIEKLKQIICLREIGVPLNEMSWHLNNSDIEVVSMLMKRLNDMNKEIENIKNQQSIIIKLLKSNDLITKRESINREIWLSILNNAEINSNTALKWHADFEKHSPAQHQKFLSALGFKPEEIQKIRTAKHSSEIKV